VEFVDMPPFKSARASPRQQSWGFTQRGNMTDFPVPEPPKMQRVTKGWWVLRRREASAESVREEDLAARPASRI
jgi:hypothetical protein